MFYKTTVASLTTSVTSHESDSEPYTLVELAGEADVTDSGWLYSLLESETRKRPAVLVVEMSALRFMDSAALQAILRAQALLDNQGGKLALVSPHGPVARVLEMTEVDRVVPVYASVAEAVATLDGGLDTRS